MTRFRSVALACSLALTSVSVLAAASSSATISNIQFQVADLTPDDAHQSGIRFSVPNRVDYLVNDAALGQSSHAIVHGNAVAPNSESVQLIEQAAVFQAGNASAGYFVDTSSIGVFGHAHGLQTSYDLATNHDVGSGYYSPAEIEIAPHTELRLSIDVFLTASATNPVVDGFLSDMYVEFAGASANFLLSYQIRGQPTHKTGFI